MSKNSFVKRTNIIHVAKQAGVSVSTASRVFDPKWEGRISDSKRQAVIDAAKELAYYGTSALGRGLSSGRTNIIALVTGVTTGFLYKQVILDFVRNLRLIGRQVMVFEADPERDVEEVIAQVHQYQVDAIVVMAAATAKSLVDSIYKTKIPIIVFNRHTKSSNISAVYCDEYSMGKKIAQFLISNGHQKISVVTGNLNASKELVRVESFCRQVTSLGGKIIEVLDGDYDYYSGAVLTRKILNSYRPDAIFCAEDTIAFGAMDVARQEFSLQIPKDLSIIGFDNLSISAYGSYDLTTVSHPIPQMIASAIAFLGQLIEAPEKQFQQAFDMEIIVRGSVKLKV